MSKYMQIYYQIIEDIENGKYNSTRKLPSEKELANNYSASVNTIRKALNNLILSGYITSRHGSGYYLSEHNNFNSLQIKSMKDIHTKQSICSKIVNFSIVQATKEQADKLGIKPKSAVYEIKRVRYINDTASLIEHTLVPVQLFPALHAEVFEDSFYHYIEEQSEFKIDRAIKDISTTVVTADIAKYFKKNIGDPVLTVENFGFLSNGVQFEYSYNIHIDEKFSISIPKL